MTMFNLIRPYDTMLDTMSSVTYKPFNDYWNANSYSNKNENEIEFVAEIPGMSRSDIDVQIKGNYLIVQASREVNYNSVKSTSKYHNSWSLPETAMFDSVTAKYDAGILTINVPLKKEYQKKISVE
jgi:HSP20 family molecular chaperone IbpA